MGNRELPSRIYNALLGFLCWTVVIALTSVTQAQTFSNSDEEPTQEIFPPVVTGEETDPDNSSHDEKEPRVAAKTKLQPAPPVLPPQNVTPTAPTAPPTRTSLSVMGVKSLLSQGNRRTRQGPAAESVSGSEATVRSATDVGSLLGRTPSIQGVGVQRRNPIVNDPRIRGNRVGELAASGSHWVPARIDLDTAVSKLDSTMVDEVNVIRGPYSVMNGPGRSFIDINLARSPRYQDGWETHAISGIEYKTNGQQLFAKEILLGGDDKSGYRAGYVHRTGNDYTSGNGTKIPASYNSREFDIALGRDLGDDDYVEFNYLRLDQTGVELPGQAFDINYLITDGFSMEYGRRNGIFCDHSKIDFWYNDTRFAGDAQRRGKEQFFPKLHNMGTGYVGSTDVNSSSIGYTAAMSWGDPDETEITLGSDLRVITQQLNEYGTGLIGTNFFRNANSPIPKSQSIDPGVFLTGQSQVSERLKLRAGVRADWVNTEVLQDPANLQHLGNYNSTGIVFTQPSFSDIVGTNQWNQSFSLVSGFIASEHQVDENWTFVSGAGVGRRPPSLTELYAAQPFMFLLQNGLNIVTGDPLLKDETFTQVDLGLQYKSDKCQAGLNGYHTWATNYITFENMNNNPTLEQTSLKYVNTDLATFAGCEGYLQYQATEFITPFLTLSYVDGRDRTRNGHFATQEVAQQPFSNVSSSRDYAQTRGAFSGVSGNAQEALPAMSPFESRVGFRFQTPKESGQVGGEISARIVASQTRVATSLLEQQTSGFTVGDLRLFWRPRPKALIYGGIENFTNVNYREHLDFRSRDGLIGIFQPGINFSLGAQLDF